MEFLIKALISLGEADFESDCEEMGEGSLAKSSPSIENVTGVLLLEPKQSSIVFMPPTPNGPAFAPPAPP